MISRTGPAVAASALTLLLLAPTASFADMLTVKADLKAASEVPPTSSKGTGQLAGTYDTVSKVLTYTVTYANLTGPAIMAHFHAPAPVGKNAPVEIPIKGNLDSPITGQATLTADQAKNLTDGQTYFNIHTNANKSGEIRGQVEASK